MSAESNGYLSKLTEICLSAGANDARLFKVEAIPFDPQLRIYCEKNACGCYRRNYACPPYVGTPDDLISKAHTRNNALLFQTVAQLEDSFDIEGMDAAASRHRDICAKIFAAIDNQIEKPIYLTAGGCPICTECGAKTGEPCRFPDRAYASLESWCINVSRLCGKCGMKYVNGPDTVTYFGMCLFD